MGLDVVEVILEAEEAFKISLADDDASRIVTAGDLHEAILRGLPEPRRTVCLTAAAFYGIRRTLVAVTGRDRREVRPSTKLSDLLPLGSRKSAWREIGRALAVRMPLLDVPAWGVPLAIGCGIAAGIALGIALPPAFVFVAAFGVIVAILISARLVFWLFGTSFPKHTQTVGQLAAAVVAKNYAQLSGGRASRDPDEVWQSLRFLLAEQLSLDPEKISKQSRLADDLGMN